MEHQPRRFLRFPPDEGTVAWIDLGEQGIGEPRPRVAALVVDEALTGCGLVVLAQDWAKEGTTCTVRVGELAPLSARIRWVKALGEGVLKLGIEFLE